MTKRVTISENPTILLAAAIGALLDTAAAELERVVADPEAAVSGTSVHDARKRLKEARALARLLAPPSKRSARFDVAVRDAGRAVATVRDGQAIRATLDSLATSTTGRSRTAVDRVRAAEHLADPISRDAPAAAAAAIERIAIARHELERLRPAPGFDPIASGVEATWRACRRGLAGLAADDDEHAHDWRKVVKRLWYQVGALRDLAPSALGPAVTTLDELSDLLGDDHDLAVLVERLATAPQAARTSRAVTTTIEAARERQAALRMRATRLGATLFAERPSAFRRRAEAYWALVGKLGPEPIPSP